MRTLCVHLCLIILGCVLCIPCLGLTNEEQQQKDQVSWDASAVERATWPNATYYVTEDGKIIYSSIKGDSNFPKFGWSGDSCPPKYNCDNPIKIYVDAALAASEGGDNETALRIYSFALKAAKDSDLDPSDIEIINDAINALNEELGQTPEPEPTKEGRPIYLIDGDPTSGIIGWHYR